MTMTRTAARLDSSRPGSGLRLVALVIAVLGSVSLGGYLLYVPAMQLYWGTYARMNPMVSLSDLMKQGSRRSAIPAPLKEGQNEPVLLSHCLASAPPNHSRSAQILLLRVDNRPGSVTQSSRGHRGGPADVASAAADCPG